tara:strand:- start:325 stop:837 length:513 start_codon:yes stop_codon:yes gene_type:complete
MFKLSKFFKLFIFFLFFSSNALAENKVVYLDLDFILSNTVVGKKLFSKLKNEEELKFKEFKTKELSLKDEENKILASKNIISKDQLDLNIKEFQKKLEKYKKFKTDQVKILKKKRNTEVLDLIKQINPLIEKYMSDNSISILIDKKNIFIANKNYDISDNLIELINKNIK